LNGISSFVFEIVEIVEDKNNLLIREQFYLDNLKPWDPNIGYNICKFAGSWLGNKHSEKTKQKLRSINSGKKLSPEVRQKMKDSHPKLSGSDHPMFGRNHSMDSRKKIVDNSPRLSGVDHPMFGKKWGKPHLSVFKEKSSGKNNPMFGKSVIEVWESKYGIEEAKRMWIESNSKRSKSVIQKTLDGFFIASYSSISEASKKTGINNSTIGIACKNPLAKAGGYKWEYKIKNI
jgi:group I intron endonuclease